MEDVAKFKALIVAKSRVVFVTLIGLTAVRSHAVALAQVAFP